MKREKPPIPFTPSEWLREIREAPPGCMIAVWIIIILAVIRLFFFD
jgi:hypothetical protein